MLRNFLCLSAFFPKLSKTARSLRGGLAGGKVNCGKLANCADTVEKRLVVSFSSPGVGKVKRRKKTKINLNFQYNIFTYDLHIRLFYRDICLERLSFSVISSQQ